MEEMLAFGNDLSFQRTSAISYETQPLLCFSILLYVINLINRDSSEEVDDDDKNVTDQKGDKSTLRRQLVLGMKSRW